ncbi:hypothetical protein [Microbulbifer litoralis]|uniref:hypothetical protein n=1 Tax=Microbulbifer litoralis TaxID=2933965 RepID=UPI0020298AE3|nr:hypothetical protein [Microbulbifer sp. GX H0434]
MKKSYTLYKSLLRSRETILGRLIILSLTILLVPLTAWSQPGNLDTTFSNDGKVTYNFDVEQGSSSQAESRGVALLNDGRILSAGSVSDTDSVDIALSLLNPDGSLDTAFGANDGTAGLQSVGFETDTAIDIESLLILADDSILTGGLVSGDPDGAIIAKFDSTGSIDTSFGNFAGAFAGPVVNTNFRIVDMVSQSDGKIVAALRSNGLDPVDQQFVVVRFLADGNLDTTFGNQGTSVIDVDVTSSDVNRPEYSQNLFLQKNKIIVSGETSDNPTMIRLNSDGSLDNSFGVNGIFTLDTNNPYDAVDLSQQSNGSIILTGKLRLGKQGQETFLLRTDPDGNLDSSFAGGSGVFSQEVFGADNPTATSIQTNDKILVAGYSSSESFTLFRMASDGTIDNTFGNGGSVEADLGSSTDEAYALSLQTNGKIVLSGRSGDDFAIVRFLGGAPNADLSVVKEPSLESVAIGTEFNYTFTINNAGPGQANNILLSDTLPVELSYISCSAPTGICNFNGSDFTAEFSQLSPGNSHTVTLTVELDVATSPGEEIQNFASVLGDENDPDMKNNSSSTSVTALAAPEALRFYLHGFDIPGTANGFTMDFSPPSPPAALALNLATAPSWYSEPSLDGSFVSGDFILQFPCSLGIGLATTYDLQRTALDGSNPETIGSKTQPLQVCTGTQTISIPVGNAEEFDEERLRLRISTLLGLSINLDLGENVWLDTTEFTESTDTPF